MNGTLEVGRLSRQPAPADLPEADAVATGAIDGGVFVRKALAWRARGLPCRIRGPDAAAELRVQLLRLVAPSIARIQPAERADAVLGVAANRRTD